MNDVRKEFEALSLTVTPLEITALEQSLMDVGMPAEEIQRLCDVHAEVFKGHIVGGEPATEDTQQDALHPANMLKQENRAIEALLDTELKSARRNYCRREIAFN